MLPPEIIVIALVILIQLYVFFRTYQYTNTLKNVFPYTGLGLKTIQFEKNEVEHLDDYQVGSKIKSSIKEVDDEMSSITESVEVDVIDAKYIYNPIFKNILNATNHYLIRNKGHATDFRIIKEIADREIESQENQIEAIINLPLYLGLLGTIVGIVLGLSSLYFTQSGGAEALIQSVETEIPKLLGGVAVAMIASFMGLLLTIISNGRLYKQAIKECDQKKSKYLSFIQTELLPILSKDTKNSIEELRDTLSSFNDVIKKTIKREFSDNVKVLNTGIGHLNTTVNELKSVQVLQNQSITELSKIDFRSLVLTFENIKTSGVELNKGFEAQKELLKYIYDTLQQIKEKEIQTRSFIADLDNTFKKSAEVLSNSAKGELNTFKSFVSEEKNVLQKAIERHRPQFGQLDHLETIKEKMDKVEPLSQVGTKVDRLAEHFEKGNLWLVHELKESNKELIKAIKESNVLAPAPIPTNVNKPKENPFRLMWSRLTKVFVK